MANATDNRLLLLVERIERLMEERKGITEDIRDVFAEAKAVGYDAATMRRVIARRAMHPGDRDEADMLLETYENALGGQGPDPAREPSAAAAEMAHLLLAEQLEGIADPAQASQLVEHVTVLLDLRAEIAALRAMEAERRKLAKHEGFLTNQLSAVVRWIEKCAKHGVEAMRAGEAVFHLYRGSLDRAEMPAAIPAVSDDPALQAKFGKGRGKSMDATMAWLSTGMGN